MKFGNISRVPLIERLLGLISAILLIAYCIKYFSLLSLLCGLPFFFLIFIASSKFRSLRNRGKPLFEITDKKLIFKTHWGSIREYPLSNFNGKVETFKVLFEEHLRTPKLDCHKGSINIGLLDKTDRKMLIDYLEAQVATLTKGK